MTMRGLIIIDVGTTSIRGLLFDETGSIRVTEQRDNPPVYYPDGRVEQDPSSWIEKLYSILSACGQTATDRGIRTEALVLTAQRSSVIPVDKDGNALRPAIMWQDKRTDRICMDLHNRVPEVYQRSGANLSPVFSAAKIRWIRENEPSVYRQTEKMVGIQDFLIHSLTGRFVTDHSFASRTNLMNLWDRNWDEELLRIFHVDRSMLCDLIPPGSIAGALGSTAAARSGLVPGLPVISGGGDQNCAALGQGVYQAGTLVANTGTGSYLIAHTDQPVLDAQRRLVCNASAIPGAYIVEASILTSGSIYRWFFEQCYSPPQEEEKSFHQIDTDARSSPPGSEGVILLPYFKGAGSPWWNPQATGTFLNLTLGSRRGDMARAVLEGISAEFRTNLALIEELTGEITRVNTAGGLTTLDLYNQIQADLMEKPVYHSPVKEATALGAWVNGVLTLGLYSSVPGALQSALASQEPKRYAPNPENRETYHRLMKRRSTAIRAIEESGFYSL